ncbi:MAG: hypothetical protein MTP17_01995 [Candidatus Midichloria sp.]|nr:MAG: hypothetical protein MTP17_01995 [Candidatus Midichloria sp.]
MLPKVVVNEGTTINTDIPGTLRAIVTHDVFLESGNNILVPKGSRLVSSYESKVKPGQTKVSIMWSKANSACW